MFLFTRLFNELVEVFIRSFEFALSLVVFVSGVITGIIVIIVAVGFLFLSIAYPIKLAYEWKPNKKNKEIV